MRHVLVGRRMTYAKHAPETVIFLAKPLTLLMRLFQAHLNLVLIVRVVTGRHMNPSCANSTVRKILSEGER